MAHCRKSPEEFIKNVFTPQIAVLCTDLAEEHCQKNNLNFIQLLQPFCKLSNDVHYKDFNGTTHTIKNFKLTFLDVNSKPPQTTIARKYLNSSVKDAPDPKPRQYVRDQRMLDVPSSTPWFESWRDTFLRVQYPSDHEYTKHFLACVLVVSSSDDNPVEKMVQLAQKVNLMQTHGPNKLPKWFSFDVLKFYVILHDNATGDRSKVKDSFENLKIAYGAANSFLLRINSRPSDTSPHNLPDPWSQFISHDFESKLSKFTPESSPESSKRAIACEIGEEANEDRSQPSSYHPLFEEAEMFEPKIEKKRKASATQTIHGACISTDDIQQIKLFVYEFVKSCLIPYLERQLATINDLVSNKKGVSKSLFSATKRWFSNTKPGQGSAAISNITYAPDSPEVQIRRLGDLYFMFGHYSAAFNCYHLAKRDYNADQAWQYYAGALEMAGLAAFMAGETNRKTLDYMEESITIYLNACKMPQFATRATILSYECLKSKNLYGEAAHQLIRMTSEDSDLRSALLLEQAAFCFLESKMIRKYAFHMVLAGHRFAKAAQRRHSLRCYKLAYQIYQNTGWDLAGDHIAYTIGRHSNSLHLFQEAVESFSVLLTPKCKQSAQQQSVFLKEYLTVLNCRITANSEKEIPILPVPVINSKVIKVLLGPSKPLTTPGKTPAIGIDFTEPDPKKETIWHRLEEMLLKEAKALPLIFKPVVTLFDIYQLGKTKPNAILNEPVQVYFQLSNVLGAAVNLKEISLLWKFNSEGVSVNNEHNLEESEKYVKTHVAKSCIIQGNSSEDIVLSVTPLATGTVTILGIHYVLSGSSNTDLISIKGKQLINIPSTSSQGSKGESTNSFIEINVLPSAPCLQVTFSELNEDFLRNEVKCISVDFRNTGTLPLTNILMATPVPNLLSSVEFQNLSRKDSDSDKDQKAGKCHITSVPLPDKQLNPGKSTSVTIWIRAPNEKHPADIDLLIYYENVDRSSIPKYRLVRHSWRLTLQESIGVEATAQEGHSSNLSEQIIISVKATNLNAVQNPISTEISLLTFGLYSNYWKLVKDNNQPEEVKLNPKESFYFTMTAKRTRKPSPIITTFPLGDGYIRTNLKKAFSSFARKSRDALYNVFEDAEKQESLPKEGIIMLQWQALVNDAKKQRLVFGQSLVPLEINRTREGEIIMDKILSDNIIDISESKAVDEEEKLKELVSYHFQHKEIIKHNFSKKKVCIIPIKLILHSLADDDSIIVIANTINAGSHPSYNKTNTYYPYASSQFTWIGNSKISTKIEPLHSKLLRLSLAVTGPGTYDLGAHLDLRSMKAGLNLPPVLQSCQMRSAIVVDNIKSK